MATNCEHYRVKTGSCGLLDKDDHTYPCDQLMLNDECPLGRDPLAALAAKTMKPFVEKMMDFAAKNKCQVSMELKNLIVSKMPKDLLETVPSDFTDFVCHAIEIAFSHFGKIQNDKAAIISRVKKVADEMIAEAKQSDSIPSSWVVGWGYNLKEAIGGIEP